MLIDLSFTDPRLTYFCPQPVDLSGESVRLERFPTASYDYLRGQFGPTANLRSSSGCAVMLRTDSPEIEVRFSRFRHHQMVPVGVDLEVEQTDGSWHVAASPDLREHTGDVHARLATGLERGQAPRTVALWLPLISTCALAGVAVREGSVIERATLPEPRWLALGDSITQGFCVQGPTQGWVHRLSRRWNLPAWNLGVGGLKIEPRVVEWALAAKRWDLITIALGSNHSWFPEDVKTAPDRAAELSEIVLAGGHERVVWLLPPYKPCENGKGPQDWFGVPLTQETGERVKSVRESLRERLSQYAPRLEVVDDLLPHDPRLYPDGLHPFAFGFAKYADTLDAALHPRS